MLRRRGKTYAGKGAFAAALLREMRVLMAFYTCFFFCSCLWVCVFSYYYYLTGLAEVCFFCFFPFVFFWLLQVNCGKLCCRFHFLPNCTQQSTDFFYATFALTLLDLIIHYKYINRNIHLICTVLCKSYCNFYNTEEKTCVTNKNWEWFRCIHITCYAIYFDFTICNTSSIVTAEQKLIEKK